MKKLLLILLCTALTCSVTACDNKKKSRAELEKNYGKVTLCDYKGLSAEKEIYTVTDEKINESIESLLFDHAVTETVTRPSKTEDTVYMTMTATKEKEVIMEYTAEDEYSIFLGYAEFGEEFDEKLTGVTAGNELNFSITYEEDYDFTDFAGATIDFKIKVLKVTEDVLPELTDTFVKETLGYDSKDALIKEVTEQLVSENESNSESALREDLLNQVIDGSKFDSYSQELYDKYSELVNESYQSYANMFGYESVEEIYDAFGMTEKDVENEILSSVYREIVVAAIALEEDITLSDKEYQEHLDKLTAENGYESSDLLVEDYGEDTLRSLFLEEDVMDLLVKNAKITEVDATEDAELEDSDSSDDDADASAGDLSESGDN